MNAEIVKSFTRYALSFIGGYAVSRGVISEAELPTVIGGLATLTGGLWSYFAARKR